MLNFRAPNLCGTSVQYSPFLDNRVVLGTAQNFGIVGNGKVFSLDVLGNGQIVVQNSFDTQDSVLSIACSEVNENHFAVACGDGSVQLFDTVVGQHPLFIRREHAREVSSINWNNIDKKLFCTASWDSTIRIWHADGTPVQTLKGGAAVIHEAKFSPRVPGLIAGAHAAEGMMLHDMRTRAPAARVAMPPGSGECMTVDWNKYKPNTVASAGSDGVIRIWDVRRTQVPTNELRGHEIAVKSVKWSPHSPQHLLSASYDMTAKVWIDDESRVVPSGTPRGLIGQFTRHTEFVTDCDWSLWGQPGWVATTSFDSNLFLWKAI